MYIVNSHHNLHQTTYLEWQILIDKILPSKKKRGNTYRAVYINKIISTFCHTGIKKAEF